MYPVKDFKLLTVYRKTPAPFPLDIWKGFEYTCVQIAPRKVFIIANIWYMRYFEFLYGSRKIYFPLNISEKLHWQHVLEKLKKADTYRLYLC